MGCLNNMLPEPIMPRSNKSELKAFYEKFEYRISENDLPNFKSLILNDCCVSADCYKNKITVKLRYANSDEIRRQDIFILKDTQ